MHDLYLDDVRWMLRYLVADTGGWLHGRLVLISPAAFESANWDEREVSLALTMQQLEDSPDVSVDLPVSRQHELELHQYYGWNPYWGGGGLLGSNLLGVWPQSFMPAPSDMEPPPPHGLSGDAHLESLRVLTGYELRAEDGSIGHLDDYIADDSTWEVRYLVVDTHHWLPGRRVLVSPRRIHDVSWSHSTIDVDLTKDEIRRSPEFDPSAPVSHEYEEVVFDYYGRPKEWKRRRQPRRSHAEQAGSLAQSHHKGGTGNAD